MSSDKILISESKSSNVGQLHVEAILKTAAGEAIAGEDVTFTLEGDGSLSPSFSAKETRRETNEAGIAKATWYRRGIFGRDVKATLAAFAPRPDMVLTLRSLAPEEVNTGPRMSWVRERHRFGR